ncbi:MAG: sn-glycerol-3-phosphate ABC transporter ATP-binding protein UgpC [Alphaproteobacteria bacterium]|nr:sn-glycerol-3-phosphate ABC transporter ATP-binding protein UgpC [Alphaproteobacteria bacterium]TAD89836.1 MAG: sn-glycerol-3-phosphate ABC transporter ATP-binding protein UgpC [Alphaproteobacteria bacterium]
MGSVSIRKVVKSYGAVPVIHGVDLEIREGEFVVFVGPSGCGKSTLLRMIAGLETITGGEIAIDGKVVNDLPPRARDIAMVFQDYALYPHLSVRENMGFGLKLRGTPAPEIEARVGDAARILKIDHLLDRKPRQLSGGQRQRVAMGRAIVRKPKVFLFDEPLSNLDALLRSEVRTEIKKLHQHLKSTIIFVTHDQVEAMTLADRIVVLKGGHIDQVGPPDTIYNAPATQFVAGFTGSPPMNFLPAELTDTHIRFENGQSLAIPDQRRPRGLPSGSRVVFGIRPEHVSRADGAAQLDMPVTLLEPLGSDTLAFLSVGEREIVGRFVPELAPRPGETARISIDMRKYHLFDQDHGRAVGSLDG